MTSSLLSFVITIIFVAIGAAASQKGKMKKTRKFIPPHPPMQQRVNQQPTQGQMRAYQQQMTMGYGKRPAQTAPGNGVPKRTPVVKKSSGSAILDRVLRENQDADTQGCIMEETGIPDSMGLYIPQIGQSPYMEEVYQMMVTGYEVKMPEQRDFLMEGLALLDQHVG